MPGTITDNGRTWVSRRLAYDYENNDSDAPLDLGPVAVGDGSAAPVGDDTALENELYRANRVGNSGEVEITSIDGEPELAARIEIVGGRDVDADTDIWEIGVFTRNSVGDSNTPILVYREVRDAPVTIESGESVWLEVRAGVV